MLDCRRVAKRCDNHDDHRHHDDDHHEIKRGPVAKNAAPRSLSSLEI
jgi:hypothetical protein